MTRVPFALLPSGGRRSLRGRVAECLAQANVMGTVNGRLVNPKRQRGLERAHRSAKLRRRSRLTGFALKFHLLKMTRPWSPEAWAAAARHRR